MNYNSNNKKLKEIYWKKQVDQNLKWLHSLLFCVEPALERCNFSVARILGLRLLGFLDFHSHSEVDQAFIYPIHRQVCCRSPLLPPVSD
jgi:hypothetical protein